MRAQADGLPRKKRAREHLRLWYGSTLPNGAFGRLDGRLVQPCRIPLPHPSGRLFGCGLEGSVRAAIRAQGPFTFAYQNPQACTT